MENSIYNNEVKLETFGEVPFNITPGGVCAPEGFLAAGSACGIKKSKSKDLALIASSVECNGAAVYTTNRVKAAPLYVTKAHLADGKAKAVIVNSANANACAPNGEENAERMCRKAAECLNINKEDVLVASTGVIGVTLPVDTIERALPDLAASLSKGGSKEAAEAIMTTDTFSKEFALEFPISGKTVKLGGIAKGSGMIHPNMGTMLCFITTDAAIEQKLLQEALLSCVKKSFNRVSVDGDTSTNDMAVVMANGLAENQLISEKGEDYETFVNGLKTLCVYLAKELARDGEGAARLVSCTVKNAESEEKAEMIAKSVASSTLVKAAMFGQDANWGRVLCAMGYSGAEFDPKKCDVYFQSDAGVIQVCENGAGLSFDEDRAAKILAQKGVEILADMKEGSFDVTAWGCDLTYDYVKINGSYRS